MQSQQTELQTAVQTFNSEKAQNFLLFIGNMRGLHSWTSEVSETQTRRPDQKPRRMGSRITLNVAVRWDVSIKSGFWTFNTVSELAQQMNVLLNKSGH